MESAKKEIKCLFWFFLIDKMNNLDKEISITIKENVLGVGVVAVGRESGWMTVCQTQDGIQEGDESVQRVTTLGTTLKMN